MENSDNIETFLNRIGEKLALTEWVNNLPDSVDAILLAWSKDENGGDVFTYHTVGTLTISDANYMTDLYKRRLLSYEVS